MAKWMIILLLVICSCLLTIWWHWPDSYLHMIVCNVGQGDAILFQLKFQQLLIDAGPDEKVLECLGKYIPFWDRTLEVVLVSHADLDHIGGLPNVLGKYQFNHLVMNPTSKQTTVIKQIESIINQRPDGMIAVTQGDSISLLSKNKDVTFKIIWPEVKQDLFNESEGQKTESNHTQTKSGLKQSELSENNMSISGIMFYGKFAVMLTGDIEELVELALCDGGLLTRVDVLKVAHHGSKTSTHPCILDMSKPEVAVVSLSKNNKFGHPHPRVIDLFRYSNIQLYRTDELGSIEIVTDGSTYWLEQERNTWYEFF